MSTHGAELLANFDVVQEVGGPIDLYHLDAIRQIRCTLPDDPRLGVQVEIVVTWPRMTGQVELVTLLFEGVVGLALPKLGGRWFGLSEFEIRDVREDLLEGICLHAVDQGDDGLEFKCRAGAFTSVGDERFAGTTPSEDDLIREKKDPNRE